MSDSSLSPASSEHEQSRKRLDQRLYQTYKQGAATHFFIKLRCRPPGIALGIILVLATCLGVGHDRNSIYQLFSLSLGMILIAIPWAFMRRTVLEGKRELPRFATAGVPIRYHVNIRNTGKKPLNRAWIMDIPPDPRPSLEEFTLLREPGENERNRFDRHFAYFRWQWLMLGNRLFIGGLSSQNLQLKPGQESRISIEITPLRRGVIKLDDLRVRLPDPFGLFQRCRKIKAPAASLTILPRRYAIPPIELPGGAAFKVSGESNTTSIGTSGEFVGLRDYRPGDPLRQIHWKSWARTGRPIVKELEDTFYPRYGLIVDTLSCSLTDHQFEEVISVAASFAASLDTSESLLDLMFIKNTAHIVTAGRGVERAEKLLEVLAGVSPERVEQFSALAQLVLRHRDDLTSCLVIFNGWDPARAEFLNLLTTQGLACCPVIIGQDRKPIGVPGYWLESGYIDRDLLRLPTRLASNL